MDRPKRQAFMRLEEYHMPKMKGMELGKKYQVHMEIEPTELSTGENEYSEGMYMAPGGKMEKAPKLPMTGRFKVHSIKSMDADGGPRGGAKMKAKGATKKVKATARY